MPSRSGGFIGVHSGLILRAETESELAGVLAHEIGHISQRHIARMLGNQKESMAIQIGALLLAILARAPRLSGGDPRRQRSSAARPQRCSSSSTSRDDAEREADRVGFTTLVNAGFDGHGMENFFGRLQQGSRLYEGRAGLPAHPPADGRTHQRHAESFAQPAFQAATRSDRVPPGQGPPAGAAGNDNAGLAR
jgi:predicted Zn-dependent protease